MPCTNVNKEVKLRYPIPPFSYHIALTFNRDLNVTNDIYEINKEARVWVKPRKKTRIWSKSYKKAKKLLYKARAGKKKYSKIALKIALQKMKKQKDLQTAGIQKESSQTAGTIKVSSESVGVRKATLLPVCNPQTAGVEKGSSQTAGNKKGSSQTAGTKKRSSQTAGTKKGSSETAGTKKESSETAGNKKGSSQTAGTKKRSSQTAGILNRSSLKQKFSLREKLTVIYKECLKKRVARSGCFVKCNYIEELIKQECLSYFIIKIKPTVFYLYFRNQGRVNYVFHSKISEEQDLFESIDNEEIPATILVQLMSCVNWSLMYDYHCFLKIEKYAHEESTQAVYSRFMLLKPSTSLLIDVARDFSYSAASNNNGKTKEELIESYEKNIYMAVSGPLYLGTNPAALQHRFLLSLYESAFVNTSLIESIAKSSRLVNKQSVSIDDVKIKLLEDLERSIPPSSSSSEEEDIYFIFPYDDESGEYLHFNLVNRKSPISENMYPNHCAICIERFEFDTPEYGVSTDGSVRCFENSKKYLFVFWNNNKFYIRLAMDKCYKFDCNAVQFVGRIEDLNRYILKLAEILSDSFSTLLQIRRKDIMGEEEIVPLNYAKENYENETFNTFSEGCMNEDNIKYDYDSSYIVRQLEQINEEEYTIKCKCCLHEETNNEQPPEIQMTNYEDFMEVDMRSEFWLTFLVSNEPFRSIFRNEVNEPVYESPYESAYRQRNNLESEELSGYSNIPPNERPPRPPTPPIEDRGDAASFCDFLESNAVTSEYCFSIDDFFSDGYHDHDEDVLKLFEDLKF